MQIKVPHVYTDRSIISPEDVFILPHVLRLLSWSATAMQDVYGDMVITHEGLLNDVSRMTSFMAEASHAPCWT